jgi:hypothetical protein
MVPDTVPAVGELIETVGGVVSGGGITGPGFTVRVALLLVALPTAFVTTTEKSAPLSAVVVAGVV